MSADVGHSSILNLSVSDRVKKYGESFPILVNRQLRSALNIAHSTKKWYSVSIAGPVTCCGGNKHTECLDRKDMLVVVLDGSIDKIFHEQE